MFFLISSDSHLHGKTSLSGLVVVISEYNYTHRTLLPDLILLQQFLWEGGDTSINPLAQAEILEQ